MNALNTTSNITPTSTLGTSRYIIVPKHVLMSKSIDVQNINITDNIHFPNGAQPKIVPNETTKNSIIDGNMTTKKIEETALEEPCTSNGGQTTSIQLFENDANICNPDFYSDINEEEVKQLQAEHFKLAKIFRTYREHPTFLKEFDKKRTTKYETLRKVLHTRTTKLNRYRRKIKHFELLARELLRTTLEGKKVVHLLEIADVTPLEANPEIQESISD